MEPVLVLGFDPSVPMFQVGNDDPIVRDDDDVDFARRLVSPAHEQIGVAEPVCWQVLLERGNAALARMEQGLDGRDWLAGEALSLADIALVAYTRMAGDGGFTLADYPRVCAWIERVEAALGLDAASRACAPK